MYIIISLGYDGHAHPHLCTDQEVGTIKPKFGIMSVCKLTPGQQKPGLQDLLDGLLETPKNWGLAVGCHPRDDGIRPVKEDIVVAKIKELHIAKKLFAVGEVGK